MSSELKTYRHKVTGLVGQYDPRVALAHPWLEEVPDGSKPLAYLPIPREVADAARAKTKNKSGDAPRDKKEEE